MWGFLNVLQHAAHIAKHTDPNGSVENLGFPAKSVGTSDAVGLKVETGEFQEACYIHCVDSLFLEVSV